MDVLVDLIIEASGRVDLRNALAKIRRERPAIAMIYWSYSDRKSDDDLPLIEVPEDTILVIHVRSGLPRLVIGSGRVVVFAVSQWGNSIDVHGGQVHVTTLGGDCKVTMSIAPAEGQPQPPISVDQPIRRLHVYRQFPERTEPPFAERITPAEVEVDTARGIPLSWLAR